jgi:protein-S-isoprenylcysteine O-methyltransferase Ste14
MPPIPISRAFSVAHHRRPDRPARSGWFLAGYAGVAGFFVVERLARRRGTAASLDASGDDQGTTRGIVTASVAAAMLAPLLRRVPIRPLPQRAAPVGLALEATGLILRVWSMRTLGASYSRTLRTTDAQGVVDDGPYRLVRHPGYAGSLLTWTGFALTSRSVPVLIAVTGLLSRAYAHRIRVEEALLRRELPGYLDYCGRTKKLIPFVS